MAIVATRLSRLAMKTRDERELAFRLLTRGGKGRRRAGTLKRVLTLRADGGRVAGAAIVLRLNPLSRDRRKALSHRAKGFGVGLKDAPEPNVVLATGPAAGLRSLVEWASNRPEAKPETRLALERELSRTTRGDHAAHLRARMADLDNAERPILASWTFATDQTAEGVARGRMGTLARDVVRLESEPIDPRESGRGACERLAAMWVIAFASDLDTDSQDVLRQAAELWFQDTNDPPADLNTLAEWACENVDWD